MSRRIEKMKRKIERAGGIVNLSGTIYRTKLLKRSLIRYSPAPTVPLRWQVGTMTCERIDRPIGPSRMRTNQENERATEHCSRLELPRESAGLRSLSKPPKHTLIRTRCAARWRRGAMDRNEDTSRPVLAWMKTDAQMREPQSVDRRSGLRRVSQDATRRV